MIFKYIDNMLQNMSSYGQDISRKFNYRIIKNLIKHLNRA